MNTSTPSNKKRKATEQFNKAKKAKMPTRFTCSECPKSYATKWNLDLHYTQIHGDGAMTSCHICNTKPMISLDALRKHQTSKMHLLNLVLQTDELNGMFKTTRSSNQNTASKNKEMNELNELNESYKNSTIVSNEEVKNRIMPVRAVRKKKNAAKAFLELQAMSTTTKRFSCSQCPKTYASKFTLNCHYTQMHGEGAPILCHICNTKPMLSLISLQQHQRSKIHKRNVALQNQKMNELNETHTSHILSAVPVLPKNRCSVNKMNDSEN